MSKNAVTETNEQQNPMVLVRRDLDKMGSEFAAALPQHIPLDRFKRVALTAINKNPGLLSADKRSLMGAFVMAAQDGLLPDGREGAIVMYGNQAQWMPMVYGIIKKMRNSGELASIGAHAVYAKDRFKYVLGDDERIEHEPTMADDRGPMVAVYATAKLKDGTIQREVMMRADVEKVRQSSRAKNGGPWKDWYEEMARKTVVRRLSKYLPMSTEVEQVLRRDDALYAVSSGSGAPQIAGPAPRTAAGQLDGFAASPMLEHDAGSRADQQDEQDQPEPNHPLVDTEGEVIFETTSSQDWMKRFEEALKITSDPVALWKVNETALEWAADMLDGGDETMLRLRQTYLEKPAETAPADDWELELEQLQEGARDCKTIPDLNAYKIEVGKRLQALPEQMFERWQSFSKTLAAELKGAK
ncbi:recombinase RecT [Azospirillum sp. A1-3]|uniref:recombinase RecT n=1 Tax=Azospirillum sp. A1-3 TaxID=185874 RepID=UPI002076D814|nr:recombinase RecT [Azospirillum sp. A1-3]MCM8736639.1 recombinase RecT [Azospirillum sp. A1-3]